MGETLLQVKNTEILLTFFTYCSQVAALVLQGVTEMI